MSLYICERFTMRKVGAAGIDKDLISRHIGWAIELSRQGQPRSFSEEEVMGLKEKIAESEALGFCQTQFFLLKLWFRRLLENKEETEFRDGLMAAAEEDNREVRETVRDFIAAHPELSPEKFGLHACYTPIAYFCAVDSVSMLLCRHARLELGDCMASYVLKEDGAACAADGTELIPVSTMEWEVRIGIARTCVTPPEEVTWNFRKAYRKEREWHATTGMSDSKKFLQWMLAALRVKPDLMHGYRATVSTENWRSVTLTPVAISIDANKLAPWKTR
jgi:hypothetical protein